MLESLSLSDHMLFDDTKRPKDDEYDGPELPVVEPISKEITLDKMWYQDLPMVVILLAHMILCLSNNRPMLGSLLYLVLTIVSATVCYFMSRPQDKKVIMDLQKIVDTFE